MVILLYEQPHGKDQSFSFLYNAANNFDLLTELKQPIGQGAVLCLRQKDIPLSPELDAIPIGYL